MAPPELRLGLIGCGTVGSAFAASLLERREVIERQTSLRLTLSQVAVKRPALPRPAAGSARVHDDAAAIAADPSIDIVIEASGAPFAGQWLRTALGRGAGVVTAHKQALARDPFFLDALARRDPRLYCEAAVAAAVPIVRALRESLAGEEIHSLRGVLNGTTTFVLSRLEERLTLEAAVRLAREAGFAEADPTDDLSGADAAAKLAILCSIAWREPVTIDRITTRGLDDAIPAIVDDASRHGARVRLVATASRNGVTRATVEPQLLELGDPLALATGVSNVVEVKTALAGTLTWYGAGAGGRSTASALLADTITAAREHLAGLKGYARGFAAGFAGGRAA